LDINVNCTLTDASTATQAFGGFVGISRSTMTITNSYSTCNIIIRNDRDQRSLTGGLVAAMGSNARVTITNCYTSGDIIARADGRTGFSADTGVYAGGMAGATRESETAPLLTITNSVVLNKRALAIAAEQEHSDRVLGYSARISALTLTNNYALLDMRTGNTDAAYPGTSVDGAADSACGLGKTASYLSLPATWTTDLNFAPAVWDFTGLDIGNGVYPALKR
jgi:hypothetical protein